MDFTAAVAMTVGAAVFEAADDVEATGARRGLRLLLDRWECVQVDDGLVVFAELVTNAIRHGGGAVRVVVSHGEQVLRFEVHDRSHAVPALPRSSDDSSGWEGLGLLVVERVSDRWGWDQTADGKVVWSEVPCCRQHR